MAQNGHRRKLQFSLLNLLFLVTTISAVVGLYRSWQTNRRLTESSQRIFAENKELRVEQGVLTIEDPTKVQAIRITDPRDGVWSYRVYLPPGHRYYLAGQANLLPMNGKPPRFGPGAPPGLSSTENGRSDRGGTMTASGCTSGEHLVVIALARNDRGEKYFSVNMTPTTPGATGAMIGKGIRDEPGKWPAVELEPPDRNKIPLSFMLAGIRVGTPTVVSPDAGPIVLFEMRFMHDNITSSADSDEGLIVWIGVADEDQSKDSPGS